MSKYDPLAVEEHDAVDPFFGIEVEEIEQPPEFTYDDLELIARALT